MGILTAERVNSIYEDCLARDLEGELVDVKGMDHTHVLKQEKLNKHRDEITALLAELPDDFQRQKGGGGWSLTDGCMDKSGNQWTEMLTIAERLFILGMGIERVAYLDPDRNHWPLYYKGVPHYIIG